MAPSFIILLLLCTVVLSRSIPPLTTPLQLQEHQRSNDTLLFPRIHPTSRIVKRDPPEISRLNILYLDESDPTITTARDMSDTDREIAQRALAAARAIADVVLNVAPGDPLIELYFGGVNQHNIIMPVFQAIRDFNPDALTPLRIIRRPAPNNPNRASVIAATNPAEHRIRLYPNFFTIPNFAEDAHEVFPQNLTPEQQDEAIDADVMTRGIAMLHELVHYVTGLDYNLLGAQYERLWPRPRLATTEYRGARDLAPSDWVEPNTNDAQIVDAIPDYARQHPDGTTVAAYLNIATRALARMNRGRDLSLMNAQNYAGFATAVFFNRRFILGVQPTRQAYAQQPSAFTQLGNIWEQQNYQGRPIWGEPIVQRLIAMLWWYGNAGALGKPRQL